MIETRLDPFQIPLDQCTWLPSPLRPLLSSALEHFLGLSRINMLYSGAANGVGGPVFFTQILEAFQIALQVDEADITHIPAQGPFVLIANHPFGMAEGLLMGKLLAERRPDFKFLGNFLLDRIPEISEHNIAVDPFGGKEAARNNVAPLRKAVQTLRQGGCLVIFPAGEVAHFDRHHRKVVESPWQTNIASLIRHAHVPVLPVYIDGRNSLLFHALGLIHPLLRTARLPRELLKARGTTVQMRVGTLIPAERLASIPTDEEITAYLRMRTFLLQPNNSESAAEKNERIRLNAKTPACQPIAPPEPATLINEEIEGLDITQHLLAEQGEFQTFIATAQRIPHTLYEIGRQREIAFRAAGEGTKQALDLDKFDQHYLHLFVWNRERQELVGAYRLGQTDEILRRFGATGLYTNTLFHFRPSLIPALGPALELGRSFVRPEYQRSYSPLLMLWKGIGGYVARNPQYHHLFGPVSISEEYSTVSRQLMVSFLEVNHFQSDMADQLQPRQPHCMKCTTEIQPQLCASRIADLDELDNLVSELEGGGKKVPILLRQYLQMGGRLLGFNVDADFSNVVDGLILVNLLDTNPRLLDRYLGKEGAAVFRAYHEAHKTSTEHLVA